MKGWKMHTAVSLNFEFLIVAFVGAAHHFVGVHTHMLVVSGRSEVHFATASVREHPLLIRLSVTIDFEHRISGRCGTGH